MNAPNILISHVYSSNNNGDAAILSAQISELQRVFDQPTIRILSVDALPPDYTFDGLPVHNALMYGAVKPGRNRLYKLVSASAMMSYTTLWALVYRAFGWRLPLPKAWRSPLQLLLEADMQVCVGGGYLRAKPDLTSTVILSLLFHQVWLAKLLGKPVYLYAQSFGPYPTGLQRRLAVAGLKQADLILVREAKSKALLDRLGVVGSHVVQVPDSAFLFQPDSQPNVAQLLGSKKSGEQLVGITVRAWLPGRAQEQYEAAIAAFIERLQRLPHLKVVVIPQVTSEQQNDDDRHVGNRLQALLGQQERVLFLHQRFSHYDIKALFAQLDYLVGTRFHSVIFALTAGVPAIAIEYEHKTSGIMEDLQLDHWVIPMEAVTTDRLWQLFGQLQKERPAYLRQLQARLPDYIASARTSSELIKQDYEARRQ